MSMIAPSLGIVLYILANVFGLPHVIETITIAAVLGRLFLVAAVTLGAKTPHLTATAYQASISLPVALGATVSAFSIYFIASVLALKGPKPSSSVESVVNAVIALAPMYFSRKWLDILLPAHLSKFFTTLRYGKHFPDLRGTRTKEYRQAYAAIFSDPLSDDKGSIKGWGYKSTHRRLALIRNGLRKRS